MSKDSDLPKRPGRPTVRQIKIDATPERVARAIFSAVKPPDPSRRVSQPKPPPKRDESGG